MNADADELQVGASFTGGGRTITDAEVALLPALMGAINPLFHDEEAAKRSPFGRRVLYGPALLGIAVAATEGFLRDRVVGLMGVDQLRFHQPVGVGDTVTASAIVVDRIEKPERAGDVLVVSDEVRNQEGTLVLSFRRTIMIRRLAG